MVVAPHWSPPFGFPYTIFSRGHNPREHKTHLTMRSQQTINIIIIIEDQVPHTHTHTYLSTTYIAIITHPRQPHRVYHIGN